MLGFRQRMVVSETGYLDFDGRQVPYDMRTHARARTIKIAVRYDGFLRITLPPRATVEHGHFFIARQRDWISQALSQRAHHIRIILPSDAPSKAHFQRAREIATEKVEEFKRRYDVQPVSLRIKDMKTKWGSCSSRGNLNFNYKFQFLPISLIDYIVVHELCHLKEMNHSRVFWNHVRQTLPDARERKRQLLCTHVY